MACNNIIASENPFSTVPVFPVSQHLKYTFCAIHIACIKQDYTFIVGNIIYRSLTLPDLIYTVSMILQCGKQLFGFFKLPLFKQINSFAILNIPYRKIALGDFF